MDHNHRIVWTFKAAADLEAIVRYISARNPSAAVEIGQGLLDRVEILTTYPLAGSALDEDTDGPYRKLIYRRWKVVYSAREDRVIVMRIWPAALGAVDFERPL